MEQQNVVTEADGTKHYFPAGTTPEEMDAALKTKSFGQKIQEQPLQKTMVGPDVAPKQIATRDQAVDFARPIIAQGAADIVGGLTAASGVGSVAAPLAYGGTYTGVDALMQYLKSKRPDSVGDALTEGGVQLGENLLLKGLTKGGVRLVKAFNGANTPEIQKFLPTTGQAASDAAEKVDPLQVGSLWDKMKLNILGTTANTIENMSLSAKEKALDRSAGAGFTEGLKLASSSEFSRLGNGQRAFSMNPNKALELVNRQMGPSNPTAALLNQPTEAFPTIASLDRVLGDKLLLDKTLAAAQTNGVGDNVRKTLAGYKFHQVFNNAIERNLDGSVGRINPDVLTKEWTDPTVQDQLKTLYNGPTRERITEFFTNIGKTQESGGYSKSGLFNVVRGGIRLGAGLLTGSLAGAGSLGTAGISGVFVAAPLLGKLLANPTAAKYITAMAGGQPLGVSEKYVAGVLASALQGSVIALEDVDGKQTPVMIKDGKMVPVGGN